MKPSEFWECEYKAMYLYCECNIIRINENLKSDIMLNEAVTDKMLKADPFLNKKPKIIPLKKMFKDLFKK